jgi:hypothetical protein
MKSAVCTLFEKDYHYGVGALANSLYKSGFRGKFYAGYRGALPPWANPVKRVDEKTDVFSVSDGLELIFIKIDTPIHFCNYKPRFMLELLTGLAADAEQLHYLDPDIVVKCSWPTMEYWATSGVGVCEDTPREMGPRHPLRLRWADWLQKRGLVVRNELGAYFNSGYLGLVPSQRSFLEQWARFNEAIALEIGQQKGIFYGSGRENPFHIPDQDTFNMALMTTEFPINAVGPEGMDLIVGEAGFLLSHSNGSFKPWRKGILNRAWHGEPPVFRQQMFWRFVSSPIRVMPPMQEFWGKLQFKLAEHLSRFYSRKCK